MTNHRLTISRATWIAAGLLALASVPASGQQIIINGRAANQPELRGGNLFTPQREKTRALRQAREFVKAENYKDALTLLQKLIDAPSDSSYFEDPERKDRFLSHKSESMRLIETLPEKGRQSYEVTYGLPAQTMLDDALKGGDFKKIEEVARRFFHTQAGYRATYVLAMKHLDEGHDLTAALHFERLRRVSRKDVGSQFEPMLSLQTAVCWGRAGMPDRSIDTLVELKRQANGDGIIIGGKTVPLFPNREAALPWLAKTLGGQRGFADLGKEQWIMFRGDASRTALSAPASPVWDSRWTLNTVIDSDVFPPAKSKALADAAEQIKSFSAIRRKDGLLMQPAAHPLLVDGLAIVRTLRGVWAVNVRTGAIEWKSLKKDDSFDEQAKLVPKSQQALNRSRVNRVGGYPSPGSKLTELQMVLDQRLWRDMTAGTLSSDGRFVFSVEDLGFHDRGNINRSVRGIPQSPELKPYNSLYAFHARTGKLAWQIGGDDQNAANPLPLSDHFFLGPPLPLGGQLFCLADFRGEIRLVALDVRKETNAKGVTFYRPKMLWYQTLVHPDENVTRFPLRRMAGLTPSYAGGALICPTTGGAVVAVDPARRLLLWGYPYPMNVEGNSRANNPFIASRYGLPTNPYDGESRWLDSAVTISGNHVVLTPRDSNELHCVSLDGTLLWKKSRGQLLYVAAVHDQNVVLAGKTQLIAYRLKDGKPAWKQDSPLPTPSGRGFQTGRFYHVPLESAEVATVDLGTGRIMARTRTRTGAVPGNLVSANGLIVSQSVDQVMAFRPFDAISLDIEQKLRDNPKDAAALAMRGEIRLRNGDEAGGLADLRKSIAEKPTDRARSLVASNLLEGLRLDFARFRKHRPELEKLLTTDALRGRYYRLLAAGLHEVGEHHDAFKEYVKLAGPNTGPWRQERISGDQHVRSDRWLLTRVTDVFQKSDPAQRKLLVAELQHQLDVAREHSGPAALRRFVAAFGTLPTTDAARFELSKRLDAKTDPLELAFVLDTIRRSKDAESAGFATAALAELFITHGKVSAAADLVAELEDRFARVVCADGKTGRQLADALRKRHAQLSKATLARSAWPQKKIVSTHTSTGSSRYYSQRPLDFEGGRGPYFRDWSFSLSQNARSLEARDATGALQWTISTQESGANYYSYYGNSLRIHGHLLVLTLGNRFMVIDGLSRSPRVLWHRDLFEAHFGQPANRGVQVRQMIRGVNGRVRFLITDPFGNPLGTVGPITNDAIVYQQGRTLFAASPMTGDVLWKRGSIERGSRLFGDDEYVFVVAQGATTATVLRSSDGSAVGSRPVAEASARKASSGRFELTARTSGNKTVLAWTDLINKQIVWQKHFADDAKAEMIEADEVGVIEPKKGRFVILNLADGKPRLDSPIEPDEGLGQFLVRRSRDRYVLLTYSPGHRNAGVFQAAAVSYYNPLINGYVYGFDRRSGKKVWTTFVGDQAMDTDQPESLPVLIFAARRYETLNGGGRGGRLIRRVQALAVTILDVRNGRVIQEYSRKNENATPHLLTVDPAARKIEVKFYQSQFTLTLADKPLPPPGTGVEQRPKARPPKKQNAAQRNAARIRLNLVVPVQRGAAPRIAPRP